MSKNEQAKSGLTQFNGLDVRFSFIMKYNFTPVMIVAMIGNKYCSCRVGGMFYYTEVDRCKLFSKTVKNNGLRVICLKSILVFARLPLP